jgi:hypothetical protein
MSNAPARTNTMIAGCMFRIISANGTCVSSICQMPFITPAAFRAIQKTRRLICVTIKRKLRQAGFMRMPHLPLKNSKQAPSRIMLLMPMVVPIAWATVTWVP